jgi:transposase InsO family protein
VPPKKFTHIHVDLVGPCNGFSYLLTVVDRTSRWLEAIPLTSTTATAVADALVAGWVARFGTPADLTSDRGVQFCSEVWGQLMAKLGINHHLTTAYHPQANGMVERAHRQIKDALRARLAGPDWLSHLPWVLLSLRASPEDDSGISSAEMLYGFPLQLPGQLLASTPAPSPSPSLHAQAQQQSYPSFLPTRSSPSPARLDKLPKSLRDASHVYVRHSGVTPPLTPVYSGPYAVILKSPKSFIVDLDGRPDVISVDRLKPQVGAAPVVLFSAT